MVHTATSVLDPQEVRAHFARHVLTGPKKDCRVCATKQAPTRAVDAESLVRRGELEERRSREAQRVLRSLFP